MSYIIKIIKKKQMESFNNAFNAIKVGYNLNEKWRGRHTIENPGAELIPGCCGKATNQFVFNNRLNVLQGPGGRIGICGTKKDNKRTYICPKCVKTQVA